MERRYAIHENRLASVKGSLSLSAPVRLGFMDKRLSKNFHLRRHHELVVQENLKLLRALEEIHSRNNAACFGANDSTAGGPSDGDMVRLAAGVSAKRSKGSLSLSAGKSHSKKLNTLLARKRNTRAALVARENEKMMEVSTGHTIRY